jgi:very-short-patch-repair endonuclease
VGTEIASEQVIHVQTRISMLARRQHGLVSRAQLIGMGVGRGAIAHRLQTGSLHPVRRGVYAVGHRALPPRAHLMAAVLACGPGAVLSHASAAALWGIRPSAATRVDVTVADRRRSRAGIRVHRAPLPPEQVTVIDGIPVTTIERTIVDLAAVLRTDGLRRAMDAAETARLPDWRIVDELVDAGHGRRGIRALRAIRAENAIGMRVTRSELERDFLDLLRRHDLPLPETNVLVEGLEVDCVWREHRLIVELDSRRHHAVTEAFERDRRRDRVLTTAGWRVVRITHRQQRYEGTAVAADLRRLMRA